jgi:hypothetical protein
VLLVDALLRRQQSTNSPISLRRKLQPRCRWRSSECDLYWVMTPMRRRPEFMQFDSAKSMMRNLPPKCTAGLARTLVRSRRREPRPPASTRRGAARDQAAFVDGFEGHDADSWSDCSRFARKQTATNGSCFSGGS